MLSYNDATLLVDGCRFLDNVAAVTGAGGLDQSHGTATLSNCVFENSIGVSGGDLNFQTMSASVAKALPEGAPLNNLRESTS